MGGRTQNLWNGPGRSRVFLLEIVNHKLAAIAAYFDVAFLKHPSVMFAQLRDQEFVAQFLLWRLPVDVEEAGVTAGRTIFQHVPPVTVQAAADGHMVRDDIQNLAQVASA